MGGLNYSEWYFYHKAMTYTVPVNYRPGSNINRGHCRRCPHDKETLVHVLTGCMYSEGFWNYRHNSVLYCVGEQITQYLDCKVDINVECQYVPSQYRVDLQVLVPGSKTLYLIDVKCPYDTQKNIENSNDRNLDHYEALAIACRAAMPNTTVTVLTLQVGCLGTWPKRSTDILTTLKIPPKVIRQIAIGCSVSNVKYSAAQWSYHRDGIVPSGIQRVSKINIEQYDEPQEGMLSMEEKDYEHVDPENIEEFDPAALEALVQSYSYRVGVQQGAVLSIEDQIEDDPSDGELVSNLYRTRIGDSSEDVDNSSWEEDLTFDDELLRLDQ